MQILFVKYICLANTSLFVVGFYIRDLFIPLYKCIFFVSKGGELQTLQVPVGGDQLTRVRLQGAKALRAGSLTAQDRLDHLYPVIMEMFHTLQDFLEVLLSSKITGPLALKHSPM